MIGAAGLPGLAVAATGVCLFAVAVMLARWRRSAEAGQTRDRGSLVGIAVQGLGFALVATGRIAVVLDPTGGIAIGKAAAAAVLVGGALALFASARRTMARNWSIVARTRADHALVTAGPFAHVRHPIYAALAMLLSGLAIGIGHEARLLVGLPVYAVGTALRIRVEERLLARHFGAAHAAYAARVPRVLPRLF